MISGKREAVQAVVAAFQADGVDTTKLTVSHAFHSPLMVPMLADFTQVARRIEYAAPQIKLIANVTGELAGDNVTNPDYWVRHVRQLVRFADGMKTLYEQGCECFVEIGPKPTLLGMGARSVPEGYGVWLPSLRRGQEDWQPLLSSLGQLYVRGVNVDWAGFHQYDACRKVVLPTYPFQRQRYWLDTPPPSQSQVGSPNGEAQPPLATHPLLGQEIELADADKIRFQAQLSPERPAYLADHRVFEQVVLPATGYVEMTLAAAREVFGPSAGLAVEELFIQQPLFLADLHQTSIQAVLSCEKDEDIDVHKSYTWQLYSKSQAALDSKRFSKSSWTRHAFGTLRAHQQPVPPSVNLDALRAKCPESVDAQAFYQSSDAGGVVYGPHFQALTELWRGDGEALGQVCLPEPLQAQADAYQLHPVLLDACLQITAAILPSGLEGVYLPSSVERLTLCGTGGYSDLWGYARARRENQENASQIAIDLDLYDAHGQMVAELTGVTFRRASQQALQRNPLAEWLYEIAWQPAQRTNATPSAYAGKPGSWLIVADPAGIGAKLAERLEAEGQRAVTISVEDHPLAEGHLSWLRKRFGPDQPPFRGVIYLGGTDTTTSVPEMAQARSVEVLHLVQALIEAEKNPRLWLVTQGAQERIEQAPLWGLGRTIAWEHPELQSVCVDLATNDTFEQAAQALFEEAWFADRENQVAYRQGTRHVARLVRYRAHANQSLPINEQSSYLITGGLGGLGLKVAQWLVDQGARELVLAGRSGANTVAAQQAVSVLEQAGANVSVVQADVAQEADVVRVLETAQKPLRGIIHAAGVLDDGILLQQSAERFEKVMAPKVLGTWHLHQLTQNLNLKTLDFFVCFSSTASLLGAGGQANYAAANAFMDGLMQQRRVMGLPGLSIHWSSWSEVGMASESGGVIAPAQGLQLLGDLLCGEAAQIAVMPLEWLVFQQSGAAQEWPFLSLVSAGQAGKSSPSGTDVLQKLEHADVATRQTLLVAYLQQCVAQVLAADASWQANIDESLMVLGLDSLMNIEFSNRIQAELAINVPVRKLLEGTSIVELADYINSLMTVQALQIDGPSLEDGEAYEEGRL